MQTAHNGTTTTTASIAAAEAMMTAMKKVRGNYLLYEGPSKSAPAHTHTGEQNNTNHGEKRNATTTIKRRRRKRSSSRKNCNVLMNRE